MRTLCCKSLCDTEALQELMPMWGERQPAEGTVERREDRSGLYPGSVT